MSKVTVQKVQGILRKAGLKLNKASDRWSSGYAVRGVYEEYPLIEIDYTNSSSQRIEGSYTQAKVEKLTSAACVLLEAGLEVLMSARIIQGATFDGNISSRYDEYRIYVRKDPARSERKDGNIWDVDLITAYFADQVAKELADSYTEQQAKQAKQAAAAKAQAERLAQVDFLNPTIGIDHNYFEGLFTTHVTLLNGHMAVLTVAYTPKQEYDWDALKDGEGNRPMYNCFEVEMTYITTSRYQNSGRERGTSNFTTGKDETINTAIRYWISRQ